MATIDRKTLMASIADASGRRNENNDCTVRAVAIVTGLPYDQVHAAFSQAGRKHRRGCRRSVTEQACKSLGYAMKSVAHESRTAVTIEREKRLQTGRYIIGMTAHLAGMIDGKLIDWTAGRRKRVNGVYSLTPIAKAVEVVHEFKKFRDVPEQFKLALI